MVNAALRAGLRHTLRFAPGVVYQERVRGQPRPHAAGGGLRLRILIRHQPADAPEHAWGVLDGQWVSATNIGPRPIVDWPVGGWALLELPFDAVAAAVGEPGLPDFPFATVLDSALTSSAHWAKGALRWVREGHEPAASTFRRLQALARQPDPLREAARAAIRAHQARSHDPPTTAVNE